MTEINHQIKRQEVIDILEMRAKTPKKVSNYAEVYWYTGRQVLVKLGLTDQTWGSHAEELDKIISILDAKKFFPPGIPITRKVDWIEQTLCVECAPIPTNSEGMIGERFECLLPDLREYMSIPTKPEKHDPSTVVSYRSYVDRVLSNK
jgi:hypothetical protein